MILVPKYMCHVSTSLVFVQSFAHSALSISKIDLNGMLTALTLLPFVKTFVAMVQTFMAVAQTFGQAVKTFRVTVKTLMATDQTFMASVKTFVPTD